MRSRRVGWGLVGGAWVACALACAGSALADEAAKPKDEAKDDGATTARVDVDFVVGSAMANAVTQNVPATLQPTGSTTFGQSRVTSFSFIFGGAVELTKGFELGLLVPLQNGTIFAPTYTRGTTSIGDVELAPEYVLHLNEGLELRLALGLALPTAQGNVIPTSANGLPQGGLGIDQTGYDRDTIQRAVAKSRGYEDNELYDSNHFGLVPKISLRWFEHHSWYVDPWVKLDNLIATTSDARFIGELVMGVNAGYEVSKAFEPAVRVWATLPLTQAYFATSDAAVAVVEPELRFHAGEGTVLVGAILPFAGPLTSPYAVGVRLAGGIRF